MIPTATETHVSPARYWAQGDAVSHGVACLLLGMSWLSWFPILSKSWSAWRVRRASSAVEAFRGAPGTPDAVAALTLADPERVPVPLADQAARLAPQPDLHLRADRHIRYEAVAQVKAAAQAGGLSKPGFMTQPKQEAK